MTPDDLMDMEATRLMNRTFDALPELRLTAVGIGVEELLRRNGQVPAPWEDGDK